MSTKIYDAYCMKATSQLETLAFTQFLKEECMTRCKDNILKVIANKTAETIDLSYLQHHLPDTLKLFYNDFDKYIVSLYRLTESPYSILKNRKKIRKSDDELLDDLRTNRAPTLRYVITEGVFNKMHLYEITKQNGAPLSINNSIVLFPISNRRTLFMTFGFQINHILYEICGANPGDAYFDIKSKYEIRDYHYQDQCDRPDNISSREWTKRKNDWDTVMPSYVPSQDGITVHLTDVDTFYDITFTESKQIMSRMPSKENMAKHLAKEITMASTADITMSTHDMTAHVLDVNHDIKEEKGRYYEMYLKHLADIEAVLPDITEEHLKMPLNHLF